ncbi:hypothetical protein SALBM135S_06011 [Streptomyces alboniger]
MHGYPHLETVRAAITALYKRLSHHTVRTFDTSVAPADVAFGDQDNLHLGAQRVAREMVRHLRLPDARVIVGFREMRHAASVELAAGPEYFVELNDRFRTHRRDIGAALAHEVMHVYPRCMPDVPRRPRQRDPHRHRRRVPGGGLAAPRRLPRGRRLLAEAGLSDTGRVRLRPGQTGPGLRRGPQDVVRQRAGLHGVHLASTGPATTSGSLRWRRPDGPGSGGTRRTGGSRRITARRAPGVCGTPGGTSSPAPGGVRCGSPSRARCAASAFGCRCGGGSGCGAGSAGPCWSATRRAARGGWPTPSAGAVQGVRQLRAGVTLGRVHLRLGEEQGVGEVRAAHVRVAEVGADQVGLPQVRLAEVRAGSVGAPEVGALEVGGLEPCADEVGAPALLLLAGAALADEFAGAQRRTLTSWRCAATSTSATSSGVPAASRSSRPGGRRACR